MRKFVFILLGIILVGGAISTFGVRQLGWDGPRFSHSDRGSSRSFEASRDRGWAHDRGGRGGSWLNFSNVLDLLNVLVGVVGIGLTISGMRMQRNAMQMSMRGRD